MYGLRGRGLGADYSTGLTVDISAAPPPDTSSPSYQAVQAAVNAPSSAVLQMLCTCQPDGTCKESGNSCEYSPSGTSPISCSAGFVPNQNILGAWSCVAPAGSGAPTTASWLTPTNIAIGAAGFGLLLVALSGRRR
jgi:hypothetical protein